MSRLKVIMVCLLLLTGTVTLVTVLQEKYYFTVFTFILLCAIWIATFKTFKYASSVTVNSSKLTDNWKAIIEVGFKKHKKEIHK